MKRYTLEAKIEDGRLKVNSENDGFNGLEVLGILQMKVVDVLAQLSGKITPDIIERKVIKE